MVGWHRRFNGHGFGWTLGVGDGQRGLACCGLWGSKELDTTERVNWTELGWKFSLFLILCRWFKFRIVWWDSHFNTGCDDWGLMRTNVNKVKAAQKYRNWKGSKDCWSGAHGTCTLVKQACVGVERAAGGSGAAEVLERHVVKNLGNKATFKLSWSGGLVWAREW